MDLKLIGGLNLEEALNMDLDVGQIYIEPPDAGTETGEDYDEEDGGGLIDNLSSNQLNTNVQLYVKGLHNNNDSNVEEGVEEVEKEIRDEDALKEALNQINVIDEDFSEQVTAVASSSRPSAASQEDLEAAASTSAEPQIIPASDEDTEAVANANRQFQITAAQRMKLASDSIHARIEIGDNIIIPIPDVDRAKADLRNIIGVVLQMDN
ncbi:hypothetical protein QE152_g39579 [Popillia japonica]|uniref:Uncharacterized protein n=1 Tax=Popillia japonica TaxID=7064 RepID=A0AAW1HU90_POPJA